MLPEPSVPGSIARPSRLGARRAVTRLGKTVDRHKTATFDIQPATLMRRGWIADVGDAVPFQVFWRSRHAPPRHDELTAGC